MLAGKGAVGWRCLRPIVHKALIEPDPPMRGCVLRDARCTPLVASSADPKLALDVYPSKV